MDTPIDETRLQPLVDNHRAFLRFLERRVGSREEAEDILQDAFGRSLEKLDGLVAMSRLCAGSTACCEMRSSTTTAGSRLPAAPRGFAAELDEAVPPPESRTSSVAASGRWPTR